MEARERAARREQARRELRRRRVAALTGLAVPLAIAAIVIAASGSPGGRGRPSAHAASPAGASSAGSAGTASSSAAGGGANASGAPGRTAVPILMYHVIAPPPAGAPFPGLYVSPAEFAAQMHALAQAGWHAVTLDQVAANWSRGVPLPSGRPIVLSFDNGYNSQYTQALPVLRSLGWVGVENIQLSGLPPSQGGLGEAQVHGLLAAGWELDTQGYDHADLVRLDAAGLRFQIAEARATLRRRYNVPVNWFCYPSGHYDATVIAAVRAAGYRGSTTVVPGWAHPGEDPYRLHRLRVLGGTSPQQLLSLLDAVRGDPPAPASYTGA